VYRSLLAINTVCVSVLCSQVPATKPAQLSVHWEELTAADFKDGIAKAQGTCLLAVGDKAVAALRRAQYNGLGLLMVSAA